VSPPPVAVEPTRVTVRDGRVVDVRMLTRDDVPALLAAVERARAEDLRRRFMGPAPKASVLVHHLQSADGVHDFALGAFTDSGRLVGVAQFDRLDDEPSAEIAIEVAHDWQRVGLGGQLLSRLAEVARGRGIERFTATFYADNLAIRRMLQHSRKIVASGFDQGEGYAVLDLSR
jgi:GNAT superfamily N-acetyltransferase